MFKQPKPQEAVIETLLQCLHTDSACCRDEPGPLADQQAEVRFSIRSQVKCLRTPRCVVSGLTGGLEGAIITVAIGHVVHFSQTFEALRAYFGHD